MPNIATILKSEIARVARKELRSEIETLRKTVSSLRGEITALKRRAVDLEQQLRKVSKNAARAQPVPEPVEDGAKTVRFSAKGMATNRRRLGLSAHDFGLLVGTTGQSVYAWESGRTQPRPKQLGGIAALRGIGKREAAARLAALNERR